MVSLDEFRALLSTGRRLRVKFGADVTAPFLHLGHAVNLWMMREMQERGHRVQFLVGDFTTAIGDPEGSDAARKPRSPDDIDRDAEAFIRQVGRILVTDDPELFEVRRNSEWWAGKPLSTFLGLLGRVTAGRLLARDMFRARAEAGAEVRANELVYPVLQGWDSVELRSDLTIVGSDQLFNESMGRFFQEREGQRPQVIVTTKITPGLDGVRKQSKSLSNFVALDDGPREAFGKIMSMPDFLVPAWMEVYTLIPLERVAEAKADMESGTLNPRDAKLELAEAVVERLHGASAAAAEAEWFRDVFSGRVFPADAPVVPCAPGQRRVLDLCAELEPSRSRAELRRLLSEGAVELDGRVLRSPDEVVELERGTERRLRLGRRRFARLVPGAPEPWPRQTRRRVRPARREGLPAGVADSVRGRDRVRGSSPGLPRPA